jgi:hypothetical protein
MIVLGLSIKQKTVFPPLVHGGNLNSVACDKTVESIEKKDHRNSLRK